ncbi:MAG: hypothetical protein NT108_01525 [Candidatus Kaiserbacteria bacterium]|nr:hypothetical protein [Candidatus Kaiserbacteria bacterium]
MRTLDDIIPPSRRRESEPLSESSNGRKSSHGSHPPKFPFVTIIAVALVIATSVGVLFYFSSSKVEVTPNTVSAAIQSSFTATKSTGNLPFEIITAQKIASQSVKGNGTKAVNSSASGTITIYNTQGKTQKLIANTRFATSAGLIFRIHSAVTVPSGTASKPGSVAAKVYADQIGASYNVGPTSFTVPGFAGTPLVNQVYARSTTAITGGASGSVPVVDTAIEAQTRSALVAALAPDLLASIQGQIPPGYVLVPGSSVTTYEESALAPSATTGQVDIKEQGTITAIIFPNAALATAVAASVTGIGYQGEPLTLSSVEGLQLAATNGLPDVNASSFAFSLSGTAPLVYSIDTARIAAAIAGKTRSAAEVALTNYPEVKRAVIILRPFWRQSFPEDPASISVVTAGSAY